MTQKFNPDSKLTAEELAKHLRQPDGETGKQIGLQMNKGNVHICLNAYKLLELRDEQRILEIGMGNGFFVKDFLQMAKGLRYDGVDYSKTMLEEARWMNAEFIEEKSVNFHFGSVEKLPFDDNTFDAITTTNTLYFWPNPPENAKELCRVLKPGGKLLVAYRDKKCMDQIAFTNHGFKKYTTMDAEMLLDVAGLDNVQTKTIIEPELDIEGKIFRMIGFYTSGLK
jgi:ubiquinone/menaquinone biosynthesis C-methylase UbiE